MTTYILNSGGISKNPELSKKFFAEIVKDLGSKPNILLCMFSQPREDWEEKFQSYQDKTDFFPKGVELNFTLAFPDTFEEQIITTDVVYIVGGDDHLLRYWLDKYDLPALWEGKVVATSSAGSNILATHFWTCDWRMNMDGLGILPIKFLPHFESDYGAGDTRGPVNWEDAYTRLEQFGDATLPIHALKEAEYVVITT